MYTFSMFVYYVKIHSGNICCISVCINLLLIITTEFSSSANIHYIARLYALCFKKYIIRVFHVHNSSVIWVIHFSNLFIQWKCKLKNSNTVQWRSYDLEGLPGIQRKHESGTTIQVKGRKEKFHKRGRNMTRNAKGVWLKTYWSHWEVEVFKYSTVLFIKKKKSLKLPRWNIQNNKWR